MVLIPCSKMPNIRIVILLRCCVQSYRSKNTGFHIQGEHMVVSQMLEFPCPSYKEFWKKVAILMWCTHSSLHICLFFLFGKDVELLNTMILSLNVGTWPIILVNISKCVLTKNIWRNYFCQKDSSKNANVDHKCSQYHEE